MQVSVQIAERHNFAAAGKHKFFGSATVNGDVWPIVVDQFPNLFDGSPDFRVRIEGGETIVRREIKDAILAACREFSARVTA